MRIGRWILLASVVVGCSATKEKDIVGLQPDIDGSLTDGSFTDVEPGQEFILPEDVTPACEGLKCQLAACAAGTSTDVSGVVYDPAGKVPLYNVIVYVPNAPLEPFTSGVTCDKCGVIASA